MKDESVINGGLNIAEAINVSAPGGCLRFAKERDNILTMFPDIVRAYIPQWERIYATVRKQEGDESH